MVSLFGEGALGGGDLVIIEGGETNILGECRNNLSWNAALMTVE